MDAECCEDVVRTSWKTPGQPELRRDRKVGIYKTVRGFPKGDSLKGGAGTWSSGCNGIPKWWASTKGTKRIRKGTKEGKEYEGTLRLLPSAGKGHKAMST